MTSIRNVTPQVGDWVRATFRGNAVEGEVYALPLSISREDLVVLDLSGGDDGALLAGDTSIVLGPHWFIEVLDPALPERS